MMAKHRPDPVSHGVPGTGSRVGANIMWNYASGFISIFGLLLLYPLAIQLVGARAYGLWVLASGAIHMLTMTDFGLGTGIVRSLAAIENSPERRLERRGFVTTAILIFFMLNIVLTGAYFVFFPLYLSSVDIPDSVKDAVGPMVVLAGLTLFVSIMGRACNSVLWAEDRPDIERKAAIVAILVRASGYAALYALGGELLGIVVVETVSLMIAPIVCLWAVHRRYSWPLLDSDFWSVHGRPFLKLSSSLSVGALAQIGVYQIPLFVVGPMLGLQAATAFGALMRIYQSCGLVVSWVALPFSYPIAQTTAAGLSEQFRKCLGLALSIGLLMVIPLVALPRELLQVWLGDQFLFASGALAVLSLGVLAESLARPSDLVLTLRGNPIVASMLRLLTLVVTIPLVLLTAAGGELGPVALATASPSLLVAVVQVHLAAKIARPGFGLREFKVCGTAVAGTIVSVTVFSVGARFLPDITAVGVCAAVLGGVALAQFVRVRRSL